MGVIFVFKSLCLYVRCSGLYFRHKDKKTDGWGLFFCFCVFMAGGLRLGVVSFAATQLLPGGRLINPSCGQLRWPCMGLQLLALRCSVLAALPLLIGRCGLGSSRIRVHQRFQLSKSSNLSRPFYRGEVYLGESLTG